MDSDYPDMVSPAELRAIAEAVENQNHAAEELSRLFYKARQDAVAHEPHAHVAGTTRGLPIDVCAVCGNDLRNRIHVSEYRALIDAA